MSIDFNKRSIAGPGKFFTCEYCPVEFQFQQNRIQHTAKHFKNKLCRTCDKLLLCINGDWYELHNHSQHEINRSFIDTNEIRADPFDFEYDLELKSEVSDPDIADDVGIGVDEDYDMFDSLSNSEPDNKDNILTPMVQSLANLKTNQTVSQASANKSPVVKPHEGQSKLQLKNKSSAIKRNTPVRKRVFTDHRPLGECFCDLCGATLANLSSLRSHMKFQHVDKRGFLCDLCDKTFSMPCNLYKHKRAVHSTELKKHDETQEIKLIPQLQQTLAKSKTSGPDKIKNSSILKPRKIGQSKLQLKNKSSAIKRNTPVRKRVFTDHRPLGECFCDLCGATLANLSSLRSHMEYQHLREKVSCDLCGKTFSLPCNLYKHKRKVHSNPLAMKCNKLISNDVEFTANHRPLGKCFCEICGTIYANFSTLRIHMEYQHLREKSSCDLCEKTFSMQSNLYKHIRRLHRSDLLKLKEHEKTHLFKSYFEMESRKTRQKSEKKLIDHLNHVPYMCMFCGKGFFNLTELKDHEQAHMGITLPCNICGKEFRLKSTLRYHLRTHSRGRAFRCNVDGCTSAFVQSGSLKKHQARLHGMVKNRNPCPICSKEFPESKYHLQRHLEAHMRNTAKEYIPESKPAVNADEPHGKHRTNKQKKKY